MYLLSDWHNELAVANSPGSGPHISIALSAENIVTDIYMVRRAEHLNYVQAYLKVGIWFPNFLECGATDALGKFRCPGNDICRASGHIRTIFSLENNSQGEVVFQCCASSGVGNLKLLVRHGGSVGAWQMIDEGCNRCIQCAWLKDSG